MTLGGASNIVKINTRDDRTPRISIKGKHRGIFGKLRNVLVDQP